MRDQYPAYQFGDSSASCDSTGAGVTKYTGNQLYFCNAAAWTQLCEVQSTPAITAPTGSGYFVLTATTYNGNLGGLAGADAKCLTELATTSTGWQGYTDASSRGLLVGGNVHAFLCIDSGSSCTNLSALTTYYFANAGNAAAGGGYFTTDVNGKGPGDTISWAAANYFSGTYNYWSARGAPSSTLWSLTGYASSNSNHCAFWASTATTAVIGSSANINELRWASSFASCATPLPIICFVNP
jgi:hypothetical protein